MAVPHTVAWWQTLLFTGLCNVAQLSSQCLAKQCIKPALLCHAEGPPRLSSFGRTLEETRAIVASLQTGVQFIRVLSQSLSVVTQLLASSTMTDVQEAITLLIYCHKFQVSFRQQQVLSTFCSLDKQELLRESALIFNPQPVEGQCCCYGNISCDGMMLFVLVACCCSIALCCSMLL